MKNKKGLLLTWICLVLLFVSSSCDSLGTQEPGATVTATNTSGNNADTGDTESNPAPDFTVLDNDGNSVKLSDFKGTPVVLNFWASWCPPCKSEMPDFNETYKTYENKVQFMMVNLTDGDRETLESAKTFLDEQEYTFPVFFDTKSEAANAYDVYSIPTTFFIDAEGNVVAYASGAIDNNTLQKGIDMIYAEK